MSGESIPIVETQGEEIVEKEITLVERLKEHIHNRGMTPHELSNIIQTTRSFVSMVLKDRAPRRFSLKRIEQIAGGLSLDPTECQELYQLWWEQEKRDQLRNVA